MVKPNVSYVKETNEVHYNPRFAIYFESGNYYVDEANYLNEIRNNVYNITQTEDGGCYIDKYGDVYDNWNGNYITNIQNEPYFNYIKKLIVVNKTDPSDNGLSLDIYENYFYVGSKKISYENGYCSGNAPV